eukprot:Pompholyxophrys_punicea_v1_NODE_108_length_3447_cov_25.761498.p1 type:complete len:169 gc:universal NODE_108_length_3447_cov_25.761498:2196-1690(-)
MLLRKEKRETKLVPTAEVTGSPALELYGTLGFWGKSRKNYLFVSNLAWSFITPYHRTPFNNDPAFVTDSLMTLPEILQSLKSENNVGKILEKEYQNGRTWRDFTRESHNNNDILLVRLENYSWRLWHMKKIRLNSGNIESKSKVEILFQKNFLIYLFRMKHGEIGLFK